MNIKNLINTNVLFLSWRPRKGDGSRYTVGKLQKTNSGNTKFEYLIDTNDYKEALGKGFQGYPAFNDHAKVYKDNILETFMSRLPPRNRGDFSKYLFNHFLPEDFSGDDFTLLAHTGAKLPSDGFALFPDFPDPFLPFDYVTEVAGSRHHINESEFANLSVGNRVTFKIEIDNPVDKDAIAVYSGNKKIGYINRILKKGFASLLLNQRMEGVILKLIPSDQRPLIYLLIKSETK